MSGIAVAVAIFLLIAFIGGVALGVVVIVSVASRREDRLQSLTGEAPGLVSAGARIVTGASTRGTGFVSASLRPWPEEDEAAHWQGPER